MKGESYNELLKKNNVIKCGKHWHKWKESSSLQAEQLAIWNCNKQVNKWKHSQLLCWLKQYTRYNVDLMMRSQDRKFTPPKFSNNINKSVKWTSPFVPHFTVCAERHSVQISPLRCHRHWYLPQVRHHRRPALCSSKVVLGVEEATKQRLFL